MSFWEELKRRSVVRVGVAYLAFVWLIVQVASIVLAAFGVAEWTLQAIILTFALLFPVVLVCAWLFEVTPDGFKRTGKASEDSTAEFALARRLDFVIIGVLSLALATVIVDQYLLDADSGYDSIAVLPFENLSGDPQQEYFVDGMTETLIANLAKIEAIRVISRTSAMRFKDADLPLPEIAAQLGASVIVEASVQRDGQRIRITAQLIDGATDQHLWAESFDRDLIDVLALQSELAQEIARQIRVTITPEEQERLGASAPVDPASYDAYLHGMQYLARSTPSDLDLAEDYFKQAQMLDPGSVQALTGLALTWAARANEQIVPTSVASPIARGYAERAELLNPNSPEVHQVLGVLAWLDGDLAESETRTQRALALEPNNVQALSALTNIFIIRKQFPQAIDRMRRATALDPLNPFLRVVLAASLMGAGKCDESIEVLYASRRMFPNLETNFPVLMACLQSTARFDELIVAEREWLMLRGETEALAALEAGLSDGGYALAIRRVAEVFEKRALLTGTRAVEVAVHYARAGDREKAIEWLQRAYELRDPSLSNVFALKMFDFVRDDERVLTLIEQLGLR